MDYNYYARYSFFPHDIAPLSMVALVVCVGRLANRLWLKLLMDI